MAACAALVQHAGAGVQLSYLVGALTQPLFLVTGGAGFLGINLCRFLLQRGYRVRSLDIAPFSYPERGSLDSLLGDIRDEAKVDHAMRGARVVVHCAAALPLSGEREIFSTNVDGTRVLLECAIRHRISRFINISSTAVYGIPDHHPIYEDDRLQGVGPYGASKIAAEGLCATYRAEGLCVPQLRPKSFVGPERLGAFELLYDWAYDGRNFPVLGSGNNRYQLLDVEDLCRAILICGTAAREQVDDTFNVAAKEFGTMRENIQAVLDRAGHGARVVPLPAYPARVALKALEFLHLSPLYRWIYETASRDSFVAVERIEAKLGFMPRYSNRDALIRNYDWYVAHRGEIGRAPGVSHRVRWRRGALRIAKLLF
jgi:nucleoside-diphosphate-sugar epimerase